MNKVVPFKITFVICLIFNFYHTQNFRTGMLTYDLFMPHPSHPQLENASLIFNDSISVFTFRKKGMNNFENKMDEGDNGSVALRVHSEDEIGSIVYRNFRKEKIVFRLNKSIYYKPKLVSDNWVLLDWEIHNETKEINSFKCQKATTFFRGRKYIAWFTTDIPLRYGPWKLYGLPGLILEAYDSKKEFYTIAKNISYPVKIENDYFIEPNKGEKMTIYEFAEFQKEIPKSANKKLMSKMPKGTIISGLKMNVNFIESEFEWEKN